MLNEDKEHIQAETEKALNHVKLKPADLCRFTPKVFLCSTTMDSTIKTHQWNLTLHSVGWIESRENNEDATQYNGRCTYAHLFQQVPSPALNSSL